jgi:phosphatidylethanolamine/phosphatidyl-N-methylethanolamine N-methyltransferase
MSAMMDSKGIVRAYGRWAPIYDLVFGPVFRQGRSAAIHAADRIGGRILEVGVGTGISLPDYASSSRLTGIDISEAMLEKARKRTRSLGLSNVEAIAVGDAEALDFPDNSFDVVVAQYVVSAVADPERALSEFARVCKPGGEIIITTRVGAEDGLRKSIEKALMPITQKLGFRTDFPFELYTAWEAGRGDVKMVERRALPPLGHFSLVRFAKLAPV